ncbi:hypothetical protein ASQ49_11750 [Acidipropionibacterium acidipropionici]|nr:hypothetical protein ASQ49_11750 [Acidipropionibacterium acidipropionici]
MGPSSHAPGNGGRRSSSSHVPGIRFRAGLPRTQKDPHLPEQVGVLEGVEMAGIEPASLKGEPDILRAQSMLSFYSALTLSPTRCEQAQSQ